MRITFKHDKNDDHFKYPVKKKTIRNKYYKNEKKKRYL